MRVTLKNRLSYAWERAARQKRLYSRVFNIQFLSEGGTGLPHIGTGGTLWDCCQWIKAVPKNGGYDIYKYSAIEFFQYDLINLSKRKKISNVSSLQEAEAFIRQWESDQKKDPHIYVEQAPKQAFRAYNLKR